LPRGLFPLVDGVQDYSAPATIYRPLRLWILRTDTSPNQVQDLNLRQTLAIDLTPRSYSSIQDISLDQGVGFFRLEAAVQVPTSTTLEIGGEFQRNPTKISALSQDCWFADHYAMVAVEGLMYWAYKLADDPRAGGIQANPSSGASVYSGQYAKFRAGIDDMARREDFGASDVYFPDDTLGAGKDGGGSSVAGYVFGY
jgi:hypothetical protein